MRSTQGGRNSPTAKSRRPLDGIFPVRALLGPDMLMGKAGCKRGGFNRLLLGLLAYGAA